MYVCICRSHTNTFRPPKEILLCFLKYLLVIYLMLYLMLILNSDLLLVNTVTYIFLFFFTCLQHICHTLEQLTNANFN